MPREFSRTARLAEQIQRELGTMLLTEVDDPRLHGVVVSGVDVSRDLRQAKVYLTLPQGPQGPLEGGDSVPAMAAFNRASGFLRRQLAARLRIRSVPALRFAEDRTLDEAHRIERLLSGTTEPGGWEH